MYEILSKEKWPNGFQLNANNKTVIQHRKSARKGRLTKKNIEALFWLIEIDCNELQQIKHM